MLDTDPGFSCGNLEGETRSFQCVEVGMSMGAAHNGGFNGAYADGSVHFVSYDLDYETYINLVNRMDGEVLGSL